MIGADSQDSTPVRREIRRGGEREDAAVAGEAGRLWDAQTLGSAAGACDNAGRVVVDLWPGTALYGLAARSQAVLDHGFVEMSNAGAAGPYEQKRQ